MPSVRNLNVWDTVVKFILFLYVIFYMFLYMGYGFIVSLLHSSFSRVSVPAVVLPYVVLLGMLWFRWRNKNAENQLKSQRIYLMTAVAGFIPVLFMIIALGINEKENAFDRNRWLIEPDKRVYMVDHFLQNAHLIGMDRQQVIEYLGDPTETEYFREKDNIVYWLGPERGLVRIDSEWLVIWFDIHNRVSRYSIERD